LLYENINKSQTSSHDAQKNIETVEKELSKIERGKFDSLPDDAKKWVHQVTTLLEEYRKRDSSLQETLRKQIEYRENLSKRIVVRIRDIFFDIFGIIDSRVLALQEEKDLVISYTRNHDFQLFVESTSKPISVGLIRFKNGSLVNIILFPGTLAQGIAQQPPMIEFSQVINSYRSHRFYFKERPRVGKVTLARGDPPLVPELAS
jgi:hypothetical protein